MERQLLIVQGTRLEAVAEIHDHQEAESLADQTRMACLQEERLLGQNLAELLLFREMHPEARQETLHRKIQGQRQLLVLVTQWLLLFLLVLLYQDLLALPQVHHLLAHFVQVGRMDLLAGARRQNMTRLLHL